MQALASIHLALPHLAMVQLASSRPALRSSLLLILCLGIVMAAPAVVSAAEDQQSKDSKPLVQAKPPPTEMERLGFLVGTWLNTTVFFDREGKEVGKFDAARDLPGGEAGTTIEPALGGWILEASAGSPWGRGWFRYEPARERYMLAACDFQGNFDILIGGFERDELVLVEIEPKPYRDGGTILWRWTYYDITEDSFRLRQAYSRDEGETWVLSNRQLYQRMET